MSNYLQREPHPAYIMSACMQPTWSMDSVKCNFQHFSLLTLPKLQIWEAAILHLVIALVLALAVNVSTTVHKILYHI